MPYFPPASSGGGAVDSVNSQTGVVVLDQDDVLDGTTHKQYSQTEKTKLSGIATGATANSSDAHLLARANHTGTQTASTISDFQTTVSANTDVVANTAKNSYPSADATKLAGIEAGADVTDATNVAAAGAIINPMTTAGDIIRATTGGAPQRLGIGSNNQVLKIVGGVPAWATDANTTYSEISEAEITAGTASTSRAISGRRAQFIVNKVAGETQTLTNKTINAANNTITGLTKADVGLNSVDNTSDATKNSASATLTNKDLTSSTNTFSNIPTRGIKPSTFELLDSPTTNFTGTSTSYADITGMSLNYTTGATAEKLFINFSAMVQNSANSGGWLIVNINGTDYTRHSAWYPAGAGIWAVANGLFTFNAAASTLYTIKLRYKVNSGTFTMIRSVDFPLAKISGWAISNA